MNIKLTQDSCKYCKNFHGPEFPCPRQPQAPLPVKDPAWKDTNPKALVGDKKLPLWLLSPIAKAAWAVAQFCGLMKYGAWNWRESGVRASTYISAIERHIEGYKNGEEYDPIDGTPHLGNIMACCGILLDAAAAGLLNDDRPPSIPMRDYFAEMEKRVEALKEKYKDKTPKHLTIADTKKPSQ